DVPRPRCKAKNKEIMLHRPIQGGALNGGTRIALQKRNIIRIGRKERKCRQKAGHCVRERRIRCDWMGWTMTNIRTSQLLKAGHQRINLIHTYSFGRAKCE